MTTAATGRAAWVLGGGVAGITAAFALADRGFRVRLCESRRWLGGRAFSSRDATTGWQLDNGPHVMLGCYRAMRTLLRRLGTEDGFQQDRRLQLAYRCVGGRALRLRLMPMPVPLAMPFALLGLRLPLSARLRGLFGLGSVMRGAAADWSLEQWLQRRHQQGAPDAFLWRPLCRAIMNVEPEHASARDFLATLREAFLGRAASAAFWVPRRSWGELIGEPAPAALAAAGVEVRTGARVAALRRQAGCASVQAIEFHDGETAPLGADDVVVSALPWFALQTLVPDASPAFGELRSSPIVSAFFETAADTAALPDEGPVVALVDGEPFHFVLRTPGGDARRFALLSGGGRSFDGQTVEHIAERAQAQLLRHYPSMSLRGAIVRIRKEQHATFVAGCGTQALRPRPGRLPGGPDNLLVCGDWTATGLPSTLEGAARSAQMMATQMTAAGAVR